MDNQQPVGAGGGQVELTMSFFFNGAVCYREPWGAGPNRGCGYFMAMTSKPIHMLKIKILSQTLHVYL